MTQNNEKKKSTLFYSTHSSIKNLTVFLQKSCLGFHNTMYIQKITLLYISRKLFAASFSILSLSSPFLFHGIRAIRQKAEKVSFLMCIATPQVSYEASQ